MKPTEDLANLRRLLDALNSGAMTIHKNGNDVTQQEIEKLKPDIRLSPKSHRTKVADLEHVSKNRRRYAQRDLRTDLEYVSRKAK